MGSGRGPVGGADRWPALWSQRGARCVWAPAARALAAALSLAALHGLAPPAAGEDPPALAETLLINSLTRDRMGELIECLQREDADAAPVVRELARVAALRVRAGDPDADAAQRAEAMASSIEAMRGVIRDNAGHPMAPIWSVDLAQVLLFEDLPLYHQNAGAFYEFGVPTADQRRAFEADAAEALGLLQNAERRLSELAAEAGVGGGESDGRVETGLWPRMIEDYRREKVPFLLAHAEYYTTLVAGADGSAPAQNRDRVLGAASDRLRVLAEANTGGGSVALAAQCLRGRVLTAQSPAGAAEGESVLDGVIASAASDNPIRVIAMLGKAVALEAQGKGREAMDLLGGIDQVPEVAKNPMFRLLAADLTHRLMLDRAESAQAGARAERVAEAYEPYERLIDDASLGEQALAVRHMVYRRWVEAYEAGGASDPSAWPAIVLRGVSELARIEGQNLTAKANSLREAGQADEADRVTEQAAAKLARVVEVNHDLLKRGSLTDRYRAASMFDLAMARYLQSVGVDEAGVTEAVSLWMKQARELPDEAVSRDAIGYAVSVSRWLAGTDPSDAARAEAYTGAAELLFERFADTEAAANERLYYANAVLIPAGRYEDAAETLSLVPPGHADYHAAQRQRLVCLKQVLDHAEKVADKNAAENRLNEAARGLIARFGNDAGGDSAGHVTAGWARLALVDTAMDRGDTQWAAEELERLADEYGEDAALTAGILERSVSAYVNLGELDSAVESAKRMIEVMPDDAAAVIDAALRRLNDRVFRLNQEADRSLVESEREALEQESLKISRAGCALASLLLDWATEKGMDEDGLVPFKVGLANAQRQSGQPRAALDLLKPLLDAYGNDPTVVFGAAEAMYAIGGDEALGEAAGYYDALIAGLEGQTDSESRRVWWHSWMRRLQISDRLGTNTAEIPLRVRQLELFDPELGGEPYSRELRRLAAKHSRTGFLSSAGSD